MTAATATTSTIKTIAISGAVIRQYQASLQAAQPQQSRHCHNAISASVAGRAVNSDLPFHNGRLPRFTERKTSLRGRSVLSRSTTYVSAVNPTVSPLVCIARTCIDISYEFVDQQARLATTAAAAWLVSKASHKTRSLSELFNVTSAKALSRKT